jgi:transglutaminase-like putative cysteine protease
MVRWVRAGIVSAALAGMIALSGAVLGGVFADALLAQAVAGSALGSVGLSLAARRLPNWVVAPMSAAVLGGYTVLALSVAAARADLDAPLATIVRDALVNGIPRLLTAMIPVEPTPDTVVVPVVAAWLAGLAGAEVGVRAGRVLLGLLPPVALYAGALYVVGPNAATAGWTTLAFAALAVAALAAGTRPGGDAAALAEVPAPTRAAVRGRAAAGAAAGLVVLLGLVAAVGPWIGGRVSATPVDPRRYVEPPQVDSLDESPLNRISGWALEPSQRLFTVRAGQAGNKRMRLRLAVLPDYDGITWRVGATYRNAGRVLPAQPLLPDTEVTEVRQQITIDGLTGRLLPVVPSPTAVTGARIAFDAGTGTVIRADQLTAGLAYSVTSQLQTPDFNLLPTAESPSGPEVARYLAFGADVPENIERLANQLADGNGAAYDRAAAIEQFLSEHYRKVADAPSGHAYPNLGFFLFGKREQGGQRGTSEQFAASFALLARLTGLPSRVVVGFDAPAAGGEVTGGDAIAWPEVLFDGLGWVAFDPMPKSKNPRPVEEDFNPRPTTPPPPPSDAPTAGESAAVSSAPTVLAAAPGRGLPGAVVAGGASGSALLVLGVAAGVVIALRRSLRRRRLSTGSPDDRIAGAWSEFTDALRLAGRPVPAHLAATEAAAFAAAPEPPRPEPPRWSVLRRAVPEPKPGATAPKARADLTETDKTDAGGPRVEPAAEALLPPLDALVAGINTVGFAPGSASHGQAENAGRQVVAYAAELRARRPWWRRAWWSVHPGPLRWNRPSGSARPRGPRVTSG